MLSTRWWFELDNNGYAFTLPQNGSELFEWCSVAKMVAFHQPSSMDLTSSACNKISGFIETDIAVPSSQFNDILPNANWNVALQTVDQINGILETGRNFYKLVNRNDGTYVPALSYDQNQYRGQFGDDVHSTRSLDAEDENDESGILDFGAIDDEQSNSSFTFQSIRNNASHSTKNSYMELSSTPATPTSLDGSISSRDSSKIPKGITTPSKFGGSSHIFTQEQKLLWQTEHKEVYMDLLNSLAMKQTNPLEDEHLRQFVIPKCYPLSSPPSEFKKYNTQLVLLRRDFDQLFVFFTSHFCYLHPHSLWHHITSTDENMMNLFSGNSNESCSLELKRQLSVEFDSPEGRSSAIFNKPNVDFVFEKVVMSKPGILQPFPRIWRQMSGLSYQPGLVDINSPVGHSSSSTISDDKQFNQWNMPIDRDYRYDPSKASMSSFFADSHVWVRHASLSPWSQVGPMTQCFANFAESNESSHIRISNNDSRLYYARLLSPLLDGYQFSNRAEYIDMVKSKFRSLHLNMRVSHMFAMASIFLSRLEELHGSFNFYPPLIDWYIKCTCLLLHPQDLIFADHVTIRPLADIYSKTTLTMNLIQLWRFSIILPTLLNQTFGRNCFDEDDADYSEYGSILIKSAIRAQRDAKNMSVDLKYYSTPNRNRTTSSSSGAKGPWVIKYDKECVRKCCKWMCSILYHLYHLISWYRFRCTSFNHPMSGSNRNSMDEDYLSPPSLEEFRDNQIFDLKSNDVEVDEYYDEVTREANIVLSKLEKMYRCT